MPTAYPFTIFFDWENRKSEIIGYTPMGAFGILIQTKERQVEEYNFKETISFKFHGTFQFKYLDKHPFDFHYWSSTFRLHIQG